MTEACLTHCNQGEWIGSCKYGDPDCPAMDRQPTEDELRTQLKNGHEIASGVFEGRGYTLDPRIKAARDERDRLILAMLEERVEMNVPVHQVPGGEKHMHVVVMSILEAEWLLDWARKGLKHEES